MIIEAHNHSWIESPKKFQIEDPVETLLKSHHGFLEEGNVTIDERNAPVAVDLQELRYLYVVTECLL